jgi:hypothetical protein
MNMRRLTTLLTAVCLLLLIYVIRLMALESFPPFIDETTHIYVAERIVNESSPLFQVWLGRQFTMWWLAVFAAPYAAPIWIARMATLLVVMLGAGALLALGLRFGGRGGMIVTGLLYAFSPFHFFFERLALADNIAGGLLLLATLFAARLRTRVNWRDALLAGVCLFLAFGAKATALPYFGIPIAAAVALTPRKRPLAQTARWLVIALGTTVGLTGAYMGVVRLRGMDVLGNSLAYAVSNRGNTSGELTAMLQRIGQNIGVNFGMVAPYLTTALMIALLAAAVVLALRRQWYLLLVLFAPLAVVWTSAVQESRFLVTAVALLLLVGGVVIGAWLNRARAAWRWGVGAAIAAWAVLAWLPLALPMYTQPTALALPPSDQSQYILSDASGFNLREAGDAALAQGDARELIGAMSNCQSLRYLLLYQLMVTCPEVSPRPEVGAALLEMLRARREVGLYVLVEEIPYVLQDVPGSLVAVIDAPVARFPLRLYDLAP